MIYVDQCLEWFGVPLSVIIKNEANMPKEILTTTKDLPNTLEKMNHNGKFDAIIKLCREGYFHDIMASIYEPKVHLINALADIPETQGIRQRIKAGLYNESELSEFQ